jgi:hypothetical protein
LAAKPAIPPAKRVLAGKADRAEHGIDKCVAKKIVAERGDQWIGIIEVRAPEARILTGDPAQEMFQQVAVQPGITEVARNAAIDDRRSHDEAEPGDPEQHRRNPIPYQSRHRTLAGCNEAVNHTTALQGVASPAQLTGRPVPLRLAARTCAVREHHAHADRVIHQRREHEQHCADDQVAAHRHIRMTFLEADSLHQLWRSGARQAIRVNSQSLHCRFARTILASLHGPPRSHQGN